MNRFAYWVSAIFNPLFVGIPVMLAIGTAALLLTAWSRVRMNEHSTIEVITGSLLGTGLMALELAWLFGWPRVI